MLLHCSRRRLLPICLLLLTAGTVVGCGFKLPWSAGQRTVTVPIQAVVLKIAFAAGSAALQVAVEEFAGVKFDAKELLRQIVEIEEPTLGTPPGDTPVIMLVNKQSNDILYWQLTEQVKMIRLRHETPGAIELKVINETPLRVELWIEGKVDGIEVEVEMRE